MGGRKQVHQLGDHSIWDKNKSEIQKKQKKINETMIKEKRSWCWGVCMYK